MAKKRSEITIEFDGPGVRPDSVDAHVALEVAAAFVDLIQHVAKTSGHDLRLTGIEVRKKCAQLAVGTPAPQQAKAASLRAVLLVSGRESIPPMLGQRVERLMRATRSAPDTMKITVAQGKWKRRLAAPVLREAEAAPEEETTLRAKIMRAGGDNPSVRLSSESEAEQFTFHVSEPEAQKLGRHLYEEIDVTARIQRDVDGRIVGGAILDWQPIEGGSSVAAWREWHAEHASEWDTVEDIEAELARD